MSLKTLGEGYERSVTELQLEATAKPSGKGKLIQLPRVYALKTFPKLTQNLNPPPRDIARWRHLQDLKLTEHNEDNIGLLIGQDVPAALRPLEIRRGGDDKPYATRPVFGLCLNGPLSSSAEGTASVDFVRVGCDSPDALLQAQVEQFWKIDGGSSVLAKSRSKYPVKTSEPSRYGKSHAVWRMDIIIWTYRSEKTSRDFLITDSWLRKDSGAWGKDSQKIQRRMRNTKQESRIYWIKDTLR